MDKSKYICPNCGGDFTLDTNIVARIDNAVEWDELELDSDGNLIYNKIDENLFPEKPHFCCDTCQTELDLSEEEVKEILKIRNERDNEVILDMNLASSA